MTAANRPPPVRPEQDAGWRDLDGHAEAAAAHLIELVAAGDTADAVAAAVDLAELSRRGAVIAPGRLAALADPAWTTALEALERFEPPVDLDDPGPTAIMARVVLLAPLRQAHGRLSADHEGAVVSLAAGPYVGGLATEVLHVLSAGAPEVYWDRLLAEGSAGPHVAYRAVAAAVAAISAGAPPDVVAARVARAARALHAHGTCDDAVWRGEDPVAQRIVDDHLPRLQAIADRGGPWTLAHDVRRFGEAVVDLPSRWDDALAERWRPPIDDTRRDGDLDLAVTIARGWAARDLNSPVAALYLGNLFEERGDHAAAERWRRRALERAPDEPGIRCNFATGLCDGGQLDEGLPLLREVRDYVAAAAARPYPGESDWDDLLALARLNLARAARAAGHLAEAEAEALLLLADPERALDATALLADLVAARGDAPVARWRALEAADVVSPYTLADLIAEALEADPPDAAEARRLIARGDDLLWVGWRDVLDHLGALMDLVAEVDERSSWRLHLVE